MQNQEIFKKGMARITPDKPQNNDGKVSQAPSQSGDDKGNQKPTEKQNNPKNDSI